MSFIPLGFLAASGAAAGDFVSIQTVSLSSSQSSVTFSSFANTFKHLQIRGISLASVSDENLRIRFNSDSGSNYARHYLGGNGSSSFSGATPNETYALGGLSPNTSAPGAYVIDILDAFSTNKYKTVKSFYGDDKNGSGYVLLCSGVWLNTNEITSISLSFTGSANFNSYSTFSLYGIKN